MFGLLGSLFTFAFALLTRGDDEEPAGVQSRPAWLFFSATLGILIVLALVVPQLLGSSWMWRLRKDGLRGFRAPHEPIKFDVEDLTTKAELLFNDIDKDDNDRLSLGELKKAVEQAQKDALEAHQKAVKAEKEMAEKAEKEEKDKAEKEEKAVLETIVRRVEERTRKKGAQLTKLEWKENIADSLF